MVSEHYNFSTISYKARVRIVEELRKVKEDRNVVYTINRKKDNWICDISRRYCLLKHLIEGKVEGRIEVTERRGRERK